MKILMIIKLNGVPNEFSSVGLVNSMIEYVEHLTVTATIFNGKSNKFENKKQFFDRKYSGEKADRSA